MKGTSGQQIPHMFKTIDEIFAPQGILSEGLTSYALRPGQIDLAYLVAEALESDRFLMAEAGTGLGKTLAYLVPSIIWAVSNDDRVVISTNTVNLQDQIWNNDIPMLQEFLPFEFSAVRIKGRSNYLCLAKWSSGFQISFDNAHSREFVDKIDKWLRSTRTGDKSELNLSSLEDTVWRQYSAEDYFCKGSKCRCASDCFLRRVRSSAGKAQIILVNHSLLLADAAGGYGILPEFSKLVVDEAHNLGESAVNQLSLSLESGDLLEIYNLLGQVTQKVKFFVGEDGFAGRETVRKQLDELTGSRSDLFRIQSETFEKMSAFFENESNGKSQVRVKPSSHDSYLDTFTEQCLALRECLSTIESNLVFEELDEDIPIGELIEEVTFAVSSTKTKLEKMSQQRGVDGYVLWVENHSGLMRLNTAPLSGGGILCDVLYSRLDSLILTSGTLRLNDSFEFFAGELGLSDIEGVIYEQIPSPFDLLNQARIYIAGELPCPDWEQDILFIEGCAEAVTSLSKVCTGNLLMLFTSHRHLLQVYQLLKCPLEEVGIKILAQDIDGERNHLVNALKTGNRVILLGTGSFWEGIDIPGESLQCVIIAKLPFPVPDSPLLEAKIESSREKGRNPFAEIFLPLCTVRLLQGIGRLIRSENDFGFIVILDSRLTQKAYGQYILNSLPEIPVVSGEIDYICSDIEEMIESRKNDT